MCRVIGGYSLWLKYERGASIVHLHNVQAVLFLMGKNYRKEHWFRFDVNEKKPSFIDEGF